MPAYKNKESGTWYVVTQYTDWTGARKQKCKRGFALLLAKVTKPAAAAAKRIPIKQPHFRR